MGQSLIFLPSHLPSCVQQPYHHPHLLLSPERKEARFIKLMKVTEIFRFSKQKQIQAGNYSSSTLSQLPTVITRGHLHHWPRYLSLSESIPFSVCGCSLSRVLLFGTLWTVAHQAPQSVGFSRKEYWSELPFSTPGDLHGPRIKPTSFASPALAGGSLSHQGSPRLCGHFALSA